MSSLLRLYKGLVSKQPFFVPVLTAGNQVFKFVNIKLIFIYFLSLFLMFLFYNLINVVF